jgi:hypothetical protein
MRQTRLAPQIELTIRSSHAYNTDGKYTSKVAPFSPGNVNENATSRRSSSQVWGKYGWLLIIVSPFRYCGKSQLPSEEICCTAAHMLGIVSPPRPRCSYCWYPAMSMLLLLYSMKIINGLDVDGHHFSKTFAKSSNHCDVTTTTMAVLKSPLSHPS